MITSNQPKMRGPGVPLPTKIMVDSHDTKPINVKNGARLKEIDTGKEFIYNEGTASWDEQPEDGGGGGGSSTLSGLTDVDISNPSDGQTLVYNASTGKWENGAGGGGLVVLQGSSVDEPFGIQLTITYAELYSMMQNGVVAVCSPDFDGIDICYTFMYSVLLSEGVYSVLGIMGPSTLEGQGAATDTVFLAESH